MKAWSYILIIVILLVAGGIIFYTLQLPTSSNQSTNTGSPQVTQPPGSSSGPQSYNVDIQNFAFSPSTMNIAKGDTITWTNYDSVPHTVTSDSGSELDSSSISPGQTYTHTFNTAGTFTYHCNFHVTMKATVIVS
ncbi:MAG: cupredoxin family copper-binding protein [Candidatus Woesearchaeota archaeon]|nr:cupredoxin family copper-binding protein [Candidatus Woesearchaeota archaeon]